MEMEEMLTQYICHLVGVSKVTANYLVNAWTLRKMINIEKTDRERKRDRKREREKGKKEGKKEEGKEEKKKKKIW